MEETPLTRDEIIALLPPEPSWMDLPGMAAPWPVQLLMVVLVTVLGTAAWWGLCVLQANLAGIKISEDVWNNIKNDAMAIVAYRAAVMFCIAFVVTQLASIFAPN